MIQNGITNFVSMLDNIMIGRIGTDQMTGVAVVNQLLFVWALCVFGGLAGIGIFTAQFYGKGDEEGVRYTMRIQLWVALALVAAGLLIFLFGSDALIRLYLHSDSSAGDVEATFRYAKRYLYTMYLEFLPFALTQIYATTLRSTGETMLPMQAGLLAVIINLTGNYILIYGKFGAPALGVVGAAAATVLARCFELCWIALHAHRNVRKYPFISGVYRSLKAPPELARACLRKGMPLLLNETLWAGGQAALIQNYSVRGLSVVAACNISQTLGNVFFISFIAMGNAISIILGQQLGAGRLKEAREDAGKHILFSVALCVAVGCVMFSVASVFPRIYNTTDDVRALAAGMIRIAACCMPMNAFLNACYFILRSGGKTIVTFLFDSCFCWVLSVPAAFVLARYTALPVLTVYLLVQLADLIKCAIGYALVRRGVWVQNITAY